jgi:DNA transformation protein and related proteins
MGLSRGGCSFGSLMFSTGLSMVYRPLRYEQMMRAAESYDVRARRMFGGMGIYTGEKMFAFLYGEEIGLKLNPTDLQEALQLGAEPLRPDPNSEPMREYVRMPREVLDNFEVFTGWVERSATYARSKLVH